MFLRHFEEMLVLVVPCRDVGSCATLQARWFSRYLAECWFSCHFEEAFLRHFEKTLVLVVPYRNVGSRGTSQNVSSCGTLTRSSFLWYLAEALALVVLPRDTGSCGTLRDVVAAL